jgi:hypothetical protein
MTNVVEFVRTWSGLQITGGLGFVSHQPIIFQIPFAGGAAEPANSGQRSRACQSLAEQPGLPVAGSGTEETNGSA